MALDDIVAKIRADAKAEAARIMAAAQDDADRVVAQAAARAATDTSRALERGRSAATSDAETLLANARLHARDAGLSARHQVAEEALARGEAVMLAMSDADYAELIARGIAASATGRETILLTAGDADRLRTTLPAALAATGVTLPLGAEPADAERGVVLVGGGVRIEVSPAALVAARRDEMLAEADRLLFPREA